MLAARIAAPRSCRRCCSPQARCLPVRQGRSSSSRTAAPRRLLRYDRRSVSVRTRTGRDYSEDFPELAAIADVLAKHWVTLDSEPVCRRDDGEAGLRRLRRRLAGLRRHCGLCSARIPLSLFSGAEPVDGRWDRPRTTVVTCGVRWGGSCWYGGSGASESSLFAPAGARGHTEAMDGVVTGGLGELVGRGGVCVLSGAGLSTESGIPDYRGPSGALRAPAADDDR